MTGLTPFGIELRKLRIERQLRLLDLAEKIGKSAALISSIETGRKPIPESFVRDVRRALDLSIDEIRILNSAKEKTIKEVKVDHLTPEHRELVAAFARRAPDLDPALMERIKKSVLKSCDDEQPFQRRRRGIQVPPRKRRDIERIALEVRAGFKCSDVAYFPIMEIIEFVMPSWVDKAFVFSVGTMEEMGRDEGRVIPADRELMLREDVYEGACRGKGRPRFTAAHELGHFFLHNQVTFARACQNDDPIYIDAEWQADTFAGALMMPHDLVAGFDDPDEAAQVFGTSLQAMNYMMKRYRQDDGPASQPGFF
jgi:transcriptional regulator with XRE-family HTH domain